MFGIRRIFWKKWNKVVWVKREQQHFCTDDRTRTVGIKLPLKENFRRARAGREAALVVEGRKSSPGILPI
jgi:hypothetical protein